MEANKNVSIEHFLLYENGNFPNNPMLPVVIYKNAFTKPVQSKVKNLLKKNNWSNSWVNGIYDYHHYHSNTHEVLVILAGSCTVALGGPSNKLIDVKTGDVLILPVGTAHKNENSSADFSCLGAYPGGSDFDIVKGTENEKAAANVNIQRTAIPEEDPLFGKEGELKNLWRMLEYDGL
jgi:uncharacterized protein YjlB